MVTLIDEGENMNEIKDFEIENGVLIKYVGEDTTVIIPNGVVELSEFCFEGTNVEEVILSSTVETISVATFNEAPKLQKIVVLKTKILHMLTFLK